jgi:hypothetical protein
VTPVLLKRYGKNQTRPLDSHTYLPVPAYPEISIRKVRMSKILGIAMALVISATSASAWAIDWKFFQAARIASVVQWEGKSQILLEVGPDTFCSVSPNDTANIALVMTLYSSGRRADIHCFPTPISIGGISAYPLHRIIAR